jgi:hypothetical protein
LTASAIVLMPLLGWAKLRLGRRLDSGATSGEGIQNIMCAVQAATALIAVGAAGIGVGFLDPLAALVIAGIAIKEGRDGWRGEDSCCAPMPGLTGAATPDGCHDDCCASAFDIRNTPNQRKAGNHPPEQTNRPVHGAGWVSDRAVTEGARRPAPR